MKGKDIDSSYFRLFLLRHLRERDDLSYLDSDYISARVEAATDEYERKLKEGAECHQAQASALAILLENYN